MATWVIDDLYQQTLEGIAHGRSLSVEQAEALIDNCPYASQDANEAGVVDGVVGEEELPGHLGTESKSACIASYKQQLLAEYRSVKDDNGMINPDTPALDYLS